MGTPEAIGGSNVIPQAMGEFLEIRVGIDNGVSDRRRRTHHSADHLRPGPFGSFLSGHLGRHPYEDIWWDSAVLEIRGSWLLLVTGGAPTADKPTVTFETPVEPDRVNHELTVRVPDCRAVYQILTSWGQVLSAL